VHSESLAKKKSKVLNLSISEEKGGTRAPAIALSYESGNVEVHILRFSTPL
jgi:hypothetical protein